MISPELTTESTVESSPARVQSKPSMSESVTRVAMEVAERTIDTTRELAGSAYEKGKEVVGDIAVSLKNTAEQYGSFVLEASKNWAKEKFESFKQISVEWKDDVVSTLRMNTIDKFKFLGSDISNNFLLKRKEKDISRCENKISRREAQELKLTSRRDDTLFKYDKAIEGIDDPDLKATFEKQKEDSMQKFDLKIEKVQHKKEKQETKKGQLSTQVTRYQENIQAAKDKVNTQVDAKIEDVKGRYRIEERSTQKEEISADIKHYTEFVGEKKVILENLEYIIAQKELGTWSARREVKQELGNLKAVIELHEKEIKRLEKLKEKVSSQISRGEEKIKKWEGVRSSYLGSTVETSQEPTFIEPPAPAASAEATIPDPTSVPEAQPQPQVEATTAPQGFGPVDSAPEDPSSPEAQGEFAPKFNEAMKNIEDGFADAVSPFELLQRVQNLGTVITENESSIEASQKDIIDEIKLKIEEASEPVEGRVIRGNVLDIIKLGVKLNQTT